MKNKSVLIGAFCISLSILFAFRPFPAKHNYQHMTIITKNYDIDHAWISIDGKEYVNQTRLKKESQGEWDFNPLINLVHQYEADGWELQSVSGNGIFYCFWLRKEK